MRKYVNIIVLAVLLIFFGVYYFMKNVTWDEVLLKVGQYDEKITIMNTADIHGHIMFADNAWGQYTTENIYGVMGLPVVKYLYDKEKQSNSNTLIVDTGDMFHGTNEANVDEGQGIVEVANKMGYTAMIPGSNDFNFGIDRFMEIKDEIQFPMLSANLYMDEQRMFEPYKIVDIGGKRIAFIGLLTPQALRNFSGDQHQNISIKDPEQEVTAVLNEIKGQADAVILLSHLGDDTDVQLAEHVDGIDLILSGRRHNLYTNAVKVRNTYIAEAGAWTTHVGIANLYFKDGKLADISWMVKSLRDGGKADPDMAEIADKYHAVAMEQTKEVVGSSAIKLNGVRTQLRTQETNFANLLADAMREKAGAEIALVNGGGIRESIDEGEISLYQLNSALPFANSLIVVEMKGDPIYKAIERGLLAYPNGTNGAFLQVSGIKYVFDASKPAGERLVEVTYNGEPLAKDKLYKVAISDYLYNGGDNYEEFKDAEVLDTGELLMNVLADYLREKKVVNPQEDGRIEAINLRYGSGLFN